MKTEDINIDELSLEQAMEKLEEIIMTMENSDISLDDSLKCYETGLKLAQKCKDSIDRVQKKIIELSPEVE